MLYRFKCSELIDLKWPILTHEVTLGPEDILQFDAPDNLLLWMHMEFMFREDPRMGNVLEFCIPQGG